MSIFFNDFTSGVEGILNFICHCHKMCSASYIVKRRNIEKAYFSLYHCVSLIIWKKQEMIHYTVRKSFTGNYFCHMSTTAMHKNFRTEN